MGFLLNGFVGGNSKGMFGQTIYLSTYNINIYV